MRKVLAPALIAGALLFVPSTTSAARHLPGCNSDGCDRRVAAKCSPSTACGQRVARRVRLKRERAEWARYHAAPMPFCTWGPESSWDPATGISYHGRPWARGRYRIVNTSSGAGGKFQFLPSTWQGMGGGRYAARAEYARPLHQERMARRLLAAYGLGQWARC